MGYIKGDKTGDSGNIWGSAWKHERFYQLSLQLCRAQLLCDPDGCEFGLKWSRLGQLHVDQHFRKSDISRHKLLSWWRTSNKQLFSLCRCCTLHWFFQFRYSGKRQTKHFWLAFACNKSSSQLHSIARISTENDSTAVCTVSRKSDSSSFGQQWSCNYTRLPWWRLVPWPNCHTALVEGRKCLWYIIYCRLKCHWSKSCYDANFYGTRWFSWEPQLSDMACHLSVFSCQQLW